MKVTNTPGQDLVLTNKAYCSPTDLRNFVASGSRLAYAVVGDVYVLSLEYPFTLYFMGFFFFFLWGNLCES